MVVFTVGDTSGNEDPVLLRHDSEFSVSSTYQDSSPNDLSVYQGAILLTAECLGTGLLALPGDIHELGFTVGMTFLLLQFPINFAAGTLLSFSAQYVEEKQRVEDRLFQAALATRDDDDDDNAQADYRALNELTAESAFTIQTTETAHTHLHHDTATYDFIGMTTALFRNSRQATRNVQLMYYTNLFLVLGNYILVMSHAVQAAIPGLCIPTAGAVATLGMLGVAQLRTMAHLGRTASVVSLAALLVVIVQCLVAVRSTSSSSSSSLSNNGATIVSTTVQAADGSTATTSANSSSLAFWVTTNTILKQLSSMGSIGFAVGSQKLLLNIRHELVRRQDAPRTLLYGLAAFGTVYVSIILLAGPSPPSFLFDAIPTGTWNRRIAGLLLWGHVMVSYAINSQALCASLERLVCPAWLNRAQPALRWMFITGCMALLSYTVANAIPFFDDLVALIGALTSVPLTLLLPALFWRKQGHYPLWQPTWDSIPSWTLLMYATVFTVTATVGSLWSIRQDWALHGAPFSC